MSWHAAPSRLADGGPHAETSAGDMTAKDGSAQRLSAAATCLSLINPAATMAARARSMVSVKSSISGVAPRTIRLRASRSWCHSGANT
jgi:hypothetical protein